MPFCHGATLNKDREVTGFISIEKMDFLEFEPRRYDFWDSWPTGSRQSIQQSALVESLQRQGLYDSELEILSAVTGRVFLSKAKPWISRKKSSPEHGDAGSAAGEPRQRAAGTAPKKCPRSGSGALAETSPQLEN